MKRKEVILKICNQWIYFNPDLRIDISCSNIPVEHLTFRTHRDIYWKIEMSAYSVGDACLTAKVSDYNTDDISGFAIQQPKKKVERVFFEDIRWVELEKLLASYRKVKLQHLISYQGDEGVPKNAIQKEAQISQPSINPGIPQFADLFIDQLHRNTSRFQLKVNIPVSEVSFHLGYVSAHALIGQTDEVIEIKVANEHIIPEFDNIKFWFAKKLRVKQFKFELDVETDLKQVLSCKAASAHIDAINPALIDSVKLERSLSLTRKPAMKNPDQSLFDADEIFNQFGDDAPEGNVFKQTENDLLKFLLDTGKVRNKRHLNYLAAQKQSAENKLRYTLQPHFGFLFLTQGETNNHFIWELLNSHATYIWSISNTEGTLHEQYKRIERIINEIRNAGRQHYRQAYQRNPLEADILFRVIEHDKINAMQSDGFVRWKNRLNEQLT